MTYAVQILADSIASGVRLTTLQATFPRFILAEVNTHRMLSRNSASSRAIPVEKRIAQIRENPFVPEAFAANKRGMQAGDTLDERDASKARDAWLLGLEGAIAATERLLDQGVHKQWANRLLEPFAWHTAIITATEWENFFALRISPMAQPEFRKIAEMMSAAMDASRPVEMDVGDWHLPLVDHEMGDEVFARSRKGALTLVELSVARCARVSYLTHEGKRDPQADITLYEALRKNGHMSPFEHAAKVATFEELKEHASWFPHEHPEAGLNWHQGFIGNFRAPWLQHRKMLDGEAVYRGT